MTHIHDFIGRLVEIERQWPDIDVEIFALTHGGEVREDTDPIFYLGSVRGNIEMLSLTIDSIEYEEVQTHWEPWMDDRRLTRFKKIPGLNDE